MVRAVELDERSVPRPCQELGVNEARQQHSARVPIQSPEPAGLRLCQAEPGHLEKLALDSTKQGVGYCAGCRCHGYHRSPPLIFLSSTAVRVWLSDSNRCTRHFHEL